MNCKTAMKNYLVSNRTQITFLLASIILLRSKLVSIPEEILSKLNIVSKGKRLTPDELSDVLQQLYIKEPDGTKTLLVPYRDTVSKACIQSVIL